MVESDTSDPRRVALAAWLRDTFATAAFQLEPASEDASFRRYFRVRMGSRTWIAMDAPPPMEDCRPFISIHRLLHDAGVHAPALHATDTARGFLLLDDLGSRHYSAVLDEENADGLYADACDALFEMQIRIGRGQVPPFDGRRLRDEADLFREWFLVRHLEIALDGALARALDGTFEALNQACIAQPQVFVHRDYHSRNLMYTEEHNPGIIDFQDAVDGPITYDLVSLLRDVYVRWPGDRVAAWVDAYYDRAVAHHLVEIDRAQFRRWFDLTGVQRHLKIAGIFARLWHRDGKVRYLDDLPLALEYLAEIAPCYAETEAVIEVLETCDVVRRMHLARDAARGTTTASSGIFDR